MAMARGGTRVAPTPAVTHSRHVAGCESQLYAHWHALHWVRCLSAGTWLLSDNVLDDCLNIEHRNAVVVQSAGLWMQGCWGLSSGTLLEFRRGCLQLRLAIRNGQKKGRVVGSLRTCDSIGVMIFWPGR